MYGESDVWHFKKILKFGNWDIAKSMEQDQTKGKVKWSLQTGTDRLTYPSHKQEIQETDQKTMRPKSPYVYFQLTTK